MFPIIWALNLQTKPSSMVWNLTRTQFPIFGALNLPSNIIQPKFVLPVASMQHHHRPLRPMLLHRRWVQPQESAVLRVRRAAGTVGHVPESGGSCHGARAFGERQQNSVGVQRFGSEKPWKNYKWQFWDWCSSLVSITKLVSVWFEVSCWDCFQAL